MLNHRLRLLVLIFVGFFLGAVLVLFQFIDQFQRRFVVVGELTVGPHIKHAGEAVDDAHHGKNNAGDNQRLDVVGSDIRKGLQDGSRLSFFLRAGILNPRELDSFNAGIFFHNLHIGCDLGTVDSCDRCNPGNVGNVGDEKPHKPDRQRLQSLCPNWQDFPDHPALVLNGHGHM